MAQWGKASIDDRKILDYLLAPDHPVGGGKAIFFAAAGYTRADWAQLRDDLLSLPKRGEVVSEQRTPFGVKYVVDGTVQSPTGRMTNIRTVWMSDGPDDPPRLVTAYPG